MASYNRVQYFPPKSVQAFKTQYNTIQQQYYGILCQMALYLHTSNISKKYHGITIMSVSKNMILPL